jgi:hypothetical protein
MVKKASLEAPKREIGLKVQGFCGYWLGAQGQGDDCPTSLPLGTRDKGQRFWADQADWATLAMPIGQLTPVPPSPQ